MKPCPFCAEQIQDEAIKCRYCGEFLDGRPRTDRPLVIPPRYLDYEYRSQFEILGWPLVHIAQGINPQTGRIRVARGVIAIGNIALGGVAIGGLTVGGFAVGGVGLGIFVLGGVALGWVALGGVALALYLAVGGVALSLAYAIGGVALAPHAIGGTGVDPEFARMLENWLPGLGGR